MFVALRHKNTFCGELCLLSFKKKNQTKDSYKIKSAVCLVCCHKPFFEAITVPIRCTKCMLPGVSCFRWCITGLKLKLKYFSSCYFPLLLGFLYPLALEAEVLRNCPEWCWLYMAKPYRREPMLAWTKHQLSSSARIRVVSFTCQATNVKKTREYVILGGQQIFHSLQLSW